MDWIAQYLPPEGAGFLLTLFLSLMIGLEIEERREQKPSFFFGGIRTYPLIAISGFLLTVLAPGNFIPFTAGLLVLGGLLSIIYWSKVEKETRGFTTEFSALATYVLGGISGVRLYWLAVSAAVTIALLIHMKSWLEAMAKRVSGREIETLAKFLIITAIILPVVPDQAFTPLQLNPRKIWMVVVAVSAISYGSYLLRLKFHQHAGILLSSALGGLYSSTATTVVLARQAKAGTASAPCAGGVLLASGVMYLRLLVLLSIFNAALIKPLLLPFLLLAGLGIGGGAGWILIWRRRSGSSGNGLADLPEGKNPLEFSTSFLFAGVFTIVLVITRLVLENMGQSGLLALAGLMGIADVDPFIMGLAQQSNQDIPLRLAAGSILLATVSNNLAKGVYAWIIGGRAAGRLAVPVMAGLAAAGLLGWLFLK